MQNLDEANRMLDVFTSVGATHFDVTFLDLDGGKRGFRPQQSLMQIKHSMPKLMPGLTARRNSLVVRPTGVKVTFIQLDDLDIAGLERVRDVAFLVLSTSPGNHQAWIAIPNSGLESVNSKDFARRLRKGVGADATASGATRVAGTVNYKRKYEPTFPPVSIDSAIEGRYVTPSQLEGLGLVATPESAKIPPLRVSTSRSWPDYERCVAGAPMNHANTGPDISRADFMWSLMSAQRRHSAEEIAARLMELSTKARENGEQYARITAANAIAASKDRGHSRR